MSKEDERIAQLGLRKNAFSQYNGYELESVELDRAVYRLEVRPESLNPYGMVHGGALYTMADDAAGSAAHSDGRYYVTQSGELHFLRNQPKGVLRAVGVVRHRGRSTVLVQVDITNEDGTLLATGEFSLFCVNKSTMDQKAPAQ